MKRSRIAVCTLLVLGACRFDIGQTDAASCTVLADPEGNEF